MSEGWRQRRKRVREGKREGGREERKRGSERE